MPNRDTMDGQRYYVPIRPAHANSMLPESDELPSPKRKRVGVQVACDMCRNKKTRCDGGHPTCAYCSQRGLTNCTYSHPRGLTDQDSLLDTCDFLKTAPSEEAINLLRLLREGDDPSVALGYMKGDDDDGRPPPAQSPFEHALMAYNPGLYPVLRPHSARDLEGSNMLRPVNAARVQVRQDVQNATHGGCRPIPPGGDVVDATDVGADSALNTFRAPFAIVHPHKTKVMLCDDRLASLDITFWTTVPISSDFAARIISLYLQTDHPLLGTFDPDSFVSDLVENETTSCSPFVVNALLYWGCQMYTAIDKEANDYAHRFCAEAERLWDVEKEHDSRLNMIGAQLLSIAYMGHGKDHQVLAFLTASVQIGERLGVYSTDDHIAQTSIQAMPHEQRLRMAYTAWGVFNYAMLISLFYSQPKVIFPSAPPILAIPSVDVVESRSSHNPATWIGAATDDVARGATEGFTHTVPHYMGITFPSVCEFWCMMHRIAVAHHDLQNHPGEWLSLQEAEMKYRELLAWAETLPPRLVRADDNTHHVLIFHMWLHASILDLFRPFLKKDKTEDAKLRTFSSPGSTARAAYYASVNQLKHLVVKFRASYESSTCTMLWQPALIYVANAMILDSSNPQSRLYFLVCFYGLEALRRPFRVSEAIGRGLLTMMLRDDILSSGDAREALGHMKQRGFDDVSGSIRATFMGDLLLAQTDPGAAIMEELAAGFEDMASFQEFVGYKDNQ